MRRFSCLFAFVLLSQGSPARREAPREVQEANDRFEREQAERIAGREKEPAERVFRNIRIERLENVPARQLLGA